MDRSLYSIRPFVDADYESQSRLENQVNPEFPISAEECRHWDRSSALQPGRLNLKCSVRENRTEGMVGFGVLRHQSHAYHPQKFAISVVVDRGHRCRGIGRALLEILEGEGRQRRAIRLWSNYREDDEPSGRFASLNGFVTLRRVWLSRLELATAQLESIPDRTEKLVERGFRFTTLVQEGTERREVQERLHRLIRLTSADVPRVGEYTPLSFEEFLAQDLGSPGFLPETVFLAAQGDEYVAVSWLERELSDAAALRIGFTGTDPRVRGLGLATQLKRCAVLLAKDRGYQYLMTINDSLNRPIWAINEKMGFRQQVTWVQGEKTVEPAGT